MLRINNRIIIRRILRNSRNDRAFRQIQLADRLAKIPSRCRFYAERAVSQVDGVHIIQENVILTHGLFQLHSKIPLLNLTPHTLGEGFIRPSGEHIVLDQLLRNGTGTLGKMPACHADHHGTQDTLHINTGMLVKTLILNCNKGMLQILRHHIQCHRNTVGIR